MIGRTKAKPFLAACAILTATLVPTTSAKIIYVDADAPPYPGTGSSWTNAYNYLQDALTDAQSSPKPVEIRVAEGVYTPDTSSANPDGSGDRYATFHLISGVALKGGYAGYGQPDPNARDIEVYKTILSGDLAGNDADVNHPSDLCDEPTRAENSYHLVTGSGTDDTAVIDGFTITAGNADYFAMTVPEPRSWGGGIYAENGGPRLVNCRITNNSAFSRGGGMYSEDSSLTFVACTFGNNSAVHSERGIRAGSGGGIYSQRGSPQLVDCAFDGNWAHGRGGAMYNSMSNPTLIGCTFSTNCASIGRGYGDEGGGAIYNDDSSPTLTNCTFSNNAAALSGGAMYNDYDSHPILTECTFRNNSAPYAPYGYGGGMYNVGSPALICCEFSGNSALVGAGILTIHGSPILRSCTFSANQAEEFGGGMYNDGHSDTVLTNCTFTENTAPYGGGMYNYGSPTLMTCTFNGNSAAEQGGGMYNKSGSPVLSNCTFTDNSAEESGGGMHNHVYTSPTLTSCTFKENWAYYWGGGMDNLTSSPILRSCMFTGNSAQWYGGAMFNDKSSSPTLSNCIFTGNVAHDGAGICNYESSLTLLHCTFNRNTLLGTPGPYEAGAITSAWQTNLTLTNCILWGNSVQEMLVYPSPDFNSVVTYTDIQGGWPGEGNTDTDPCYASPGYWADANDPNSALEPDDPNAIWIDGDYHLKSQVGRWDPDAHAWVTDDVTSPCIDAGDPNSDWTGELWPHGKRVNMGAYGGTLQASMSRSKAWNIADVDVDGFVCYSDVSLLSEKWLCEAVLLPEDLSRDGIVSLPDLAILANNWRNWELPDRAADPDPPDGMMDVEVCSNLSWTPGHGAQSHDLYFGTTNPPPFIGNQIWATYSPAQMSDLTVYLWRVDEVNPAGITTGAVWDFTTGQEPKGPRCFPAETLVWADGKLVQISEVLPGQKLGRFEALALAAREPQVDSIDEHEGVFPECYDIVLETGNCITVVNSHFFLPDSGRWTRVQDLRPGCQLQSLTGPVTVKNIVRRQTPYVGKVYNLKIKSSDRYCVGQDALIARDY
jgi:hypothetical protein